MIRQFLGSEDGPTAVEYAVMLAFVILFALAAVTSMGGSMKTFFTDVDTSVDKLPGTP